MAQMVQKSIKRLLEPTLEMNHSRSCFLQLNRQLGPAPLFHQFRDECLSGGRQTALLSTHNMLFDTKTLSICSDGCHKHTFLVIA